MTLQMVTCPLCCQPGFNTSNALCSALINASTRKLICPMCDELLIGLDKLTIHLFSHNTSNKNLVNSSRSPSSECQSKISATQNPREDCVNSIAAPVLYIQADNGQLFALAPSSLVNQFGSVTINTQNYISNTNVCENNFDDSQYVSREGENSKETPEFSSCKDLLTSGDFSEHFVDPPGVSEQSSSEKIIGDFHTVRNEPNCMQTNFGDIEIDENVLQSPDLSRLSSVDGVGTESPKPLVPCDVCEMMFSNKAILAVHRQLMHKHLVLSEESENGIQKSCEKSKRKPLNCSWCSATFNLKSSLIIHVKVTHPAQKESFERKEAEKVICPVCEKTFPKESTLNQHMKSVHGEKPWQCSVCSKSFTTKYFLRKHRRIHTGETPYECTICHKVFTFQQSYHKHMLYHTDDKPYCCSHCGRLFKELSTLNNHERIHSGEKPFACETCGKCFRQRVSYLVHRRIHTGAMPYKCTACNKSFRYKISQRTHKCPEHPPGVVVKMHSTLVDRLQAAMNLGEDGGKDQANSNSESTSHSTPSEFLDHVNPSTSSRTFSTLYNQSDVQLGSKPSSHSTANTNLNTENSCGTPDQYKSHAIKTDLSNLGLNREAGINQEMNSSQTFPSLSDLNEIQVAGKTNKSSADEADMFSMNLDSSPSECLGKLHISSNEYRQSMSPQNPRSPVILPHPNLGFDNMEDLDLCNLLFDLS